MSKLTINFTSQFFIYLHTNAKKIIISSFILKYIIFILTAIELIISIDTMSFSQLFRNFIKLPTYMKNIKYKLFEIVSLLHLKRFCIYLAHIVPCQL